MARKKFENVRPAIHRLDLTRHVAFFVESQERMILVGPTEVSICSFQQAEDTLKRLKQEKGRT